MRTRVVSAPSSCPGDLRLDAPWPPSATPARSVSAVSPSPYPSQRLRQGQHLIRTVDDQIHARRYRPTHHQIPHPPFPRSPSFRRAPPTQAGQEEEEQRGQEAEMLFVQLASETERQQVVHGQRARRRATRSPCAAE